jgi:uncharacterized membrane protein
LLVASPALQRVLVYPQTEFFTEMWLLGLEQKAENYPFNISASNKYNLFLGLGNHQGNFSYYQVQVKLRNSTQPGPDSFNRTPSSLTPLYTINAFVPDNATWELPISFSFSYVTDVNTSQINLSNLIFNGETLDLSGYSALLDSEKQQYLVNFFFEVWIYDESSSVFKYHERYTGLWLNLQ